MLFKYNNKKFMKKILKIISVLIIILIISVLGYYFYEANQNQNNNQQPASVEKYEYPELTSDVIKEIGGQDIADKLIGKFEKATNDLDDAIEKYENGGKEEIDKPSVILFVEVGKYARYVRKYDLAVETLESVFDYYDESDIALINMAHVYEDMGEYQKAIDTYLRFYKMFSEAGPEQFHLDIMHDYIALDNKEKVVKYYSEYKKAGYKSEQIEQYLAK